MTNRLASEKSPYLQQHKNNPVDWYPWSNEAFEEAKRSNKPIFLSIGYATCHWCHVMEHESFEDEEIASLLNDAFVNIKVDREERPDIDSTYMTVCQMLNGQGGWPLTVVMTPGKEPFFATTYIPKDTRFNRIGLRQLIPGIKGMWTHEPAKIRKAVDQIREGYQRSLKFETGDLPDDSDCRNAAKLLMQRYDKDYGGFDNAPKFPSPHNLMFLLRHWYYNRDQSSLNAIHHTLRSMRFGGIWDHIGGGFHRYATDKSWLLPHFEKMLYDQALMIMAYTEGWLVTKDHLLQSTAKDIISYVLTQLKSPGGAFYSAEDADSEGEEGKFYTWKDDELRSLLTPDDHRWLTTTFNIEAEGNFKDEATGKKNGTNILHLSDQIDTADADRWERIRKKLSDERNKRVRPLLDDKILCDWNGLMIAALAKAGVAFHSDDYIKTAEKAFECVQELFWQPTSKTLYHRHRDGETSIEGFADDYASLLWAALELYQATFKLWYLQQAITLSEQLCERFLDKEHGGFIQHANQDELPLESQKQIYDGAIPSANSIAVFNLIRLSKFTGDSAWEDIAHKTLKIFSNELKTSGSSITMAMMAVQFYSYQPREIVITEGEGVDDMIGYLRSQFLPGSIQLLKRKNDSKLTEISPYVKQLKSKNEQSTAYVCTNFSCNQPVVSVADLKTLIEK